MTDPAEVEILVVEDSDDDAEMTLDALTECGLGDNVTRLRDGAAAIDYLFCRGEYAQRPAGLPRMLLLDINMPRMDGLEVLRVLREDPAMDALPVVLLTSSAEERDRHRAYALHANSYIIKPVNFEQFVKAVRELGLYWLFLNKQR